jgi:hypothetical protein
MPSPVGARMMYVALLRGINVGGNRKVDMKLLKGTFEGSDTLAGSLFLPRQATEADNGTQRCASGGNPPMPTLAGETEG